jgi:hypothetical protein
LTLCGHTHGGQINLPLLGSPFMRAEPGQKSYVYGVYAEGMRQLVVSGGLGTSYVPVRVLRPPEVVTLHLTGTAGA